MSFDPSGIPAMSSEIQSLKDRLRTVNATLATLDDQEESLEAEWTAAGIRGEDTSSLDTRLEEVEKERRREYKLRGLLENEIDVVQMRLNEAIGKAGRDELGERARAQLDLATRIEVAFEEHVRPLLKEHVAASLKMREVAAKARKHGTKARSVDPNRLPSAMRLGRFLRGRLAQVDPAMLKGPVTREPLEALEAEAYRQVLSK